MDRESWRILAFKKMKDSYKVNLSLDISMRSSYAILIDELSRPATLVANIIV